MDNQTPQALDINDIITPIGVNAWPPAPGWWLLGLFIVGVITAGYFFYTAHTQKWGYRYAALKYLQTNFDQYYQDQNEQCFVTELMSILKRVSSTVYGSQSHNTLNPQLFLQFANSVVDNAVFSEQSLNTIEQALYTNRCSLDVNAFYLECCQWIKAHPMNLEDGGKVNV